MIFSGKHDKFGNILPTCVGEIQFSSNEGFSIDDAIVITGAEGSFDGVDAEYKYLVQRFGEKSVDWTLKMQVLHENEGKAYDQMQIIDIKEQREFSIFFDITEFFGKEIF